MSHRPYNFALAEKRRLAKQRPTTPPVVRIGGEDSPFYAEVVPFFAEVTDELRAELAEAMQQAAQRNPEAAWTYAVRQAKRKRSERPEKLARAQERLTLAEQAMQQRGVSVRTTERLGVRVIALDAPGNAQSSGEEWAS